jgi:hypothetical protein
MHLPEKVDPPALTVGRGTVNNTTYSETYQSLIGFKAPGLIGGREIFHCAKKKGMRDGRYRK